MDAIDNQAVSTAIVTILRATGLAEAVTAALREQGIIETPEAAPATGVSLEALEGFTNRLDEIVGQTGCGSMPEVPEIDLSSLAERAADAAYTAAQQEIESYEPDFDSYEYEQAVETVEQARDAAIDLRDQMREAIEAARANGNPVSPEAEAAAGL